MTENPAPANAAIKSPHDGRDYLWSEIGHGAAPFDWSVGYDGEARAAQILANAGFKFPIKDQNGSGSCGGQAESYGGGMLAVVHDKTFDEKSAKFSYAPVAYVAGGGGSNGRDLANRAINAGWGREALTPSYENGQPPSEAFMERAQDITEDAATKALKDKALSYVLLPLDIDSVAQAVRDYGFVRIGITGANNGTWGSPDPVPPNDANAPWYHWVCLMKAQMRNGKKAIGFPNSWGTATGDHGWQWLSEDWFKAHLSNNPYGAVPLWEPRCYVWNDTPTPSTFKHTFNTDLQFGMTSPEVNFLQQGLQLDGDFPQSIVPTNYFGNITLTALQKFQVKFNIVAPGQPGYGRCGPLTRAQLNKLYAQ